jgi:hypothetical protein
MDYETGANIQLTLGSIKSEIACLNTTVTWGFWLAIFVFAVQPSDDIKNDLSKCEAMGIAARVDELGRRDRLLAYCMEGSGYDFKWEADGCFLHDRESCYEKRGAWRTTKLTASRWWDRARQLTRSP